MSTHAYPLRADQPESFLSCGYWTGNTTSSPTKVMGPGLTVTRTAEGVFLLAWARIGAKLAGLPMATLADNTAIDTAGWSVCFDYNSYSESARTIAFSVYADDDTTISDLPVTMGLGLMVPLTLTEVAG